MYSRFDICKQTKTKTNKHRTGEAVLNVPIDSSRSFDVSISLRSVPYWGKHRAGIRGRHGMRHLQRDNRSRRLPMALTANSTFLARSWTSFTQQALTSTSSTSHLQHLHVLGLYYQRQCFRQIHSTLDISFASTDSIWGGEAHLIQT